MKSSPSTVRVTRRFAAILGTILITAALVAPVSVQASSSSASLTALAKARATNATTSLRPSAPAENQAASAPSATSWIATGMAFVKTFT
ncbi:MAG: hypothetical protein ABIZ34_03515, partial [Candidatus Limnocylindrales bacterium]